MALELYNYLQQESDIQDHKLYIIFIAELLGVLACMRACVRARVRVYSLGVDE